MEKTRFSSHFFDGKDLAVFFKKDLLMRNIFLFGRSMFVEDFGGLGARSLGSSRNDHRAGHGRVQPEIYPKEEYFPFLGVPHPPC